MANYALHIRFEIMRDYDRTTTSSTNYHGRETDRNVPKRGFSRDCPTEILLSLRSLYAPPAECTQPLLFQLYIFNLIVTL